MITKLAMIDARRERFDEAAAWIGRAREAVRNSAAAGLITAELRDQLDAGHALEQAVFQHARQAIDQAGSIEKHPPEIARRLWGIRAPALARRGEIRQAIESAERTRRLVPGDVEALGVVARTYGLCVRAETSASSSGRGVGAGREKDTHYAERAIEALAEAERLQPGCVRNGWMDPEVNVLYAFPAYRKLLTLGVEKAGGG